MTGILNLAANTRRPDEVYARLLSLQDGLSDGECLRAFAALVLLLANHIGDESVVFSAIDAARRQLRPQAGSSAPPPAGELP
jgi:Protein of unknown function (DUF2783)